ncbi:hypothetical protein CHGG_08268 [Chaetomium globosum CBS 148.51]|uniref:protein-ribulosamine 3-kinase n=1 Tax=Chaetomium globosum (strain ATCC 6205 / CBS 148.51 / DSM 1962 / NBRC 6347 / NRRL 1970) TaxID=306901 RepID=Q2GUT6_CHAGB|nr:uncharacterized protein CHGG_08268 [Chaetomium globosum CBS 148.51]EAQ87015.1 hypothetical protein CHGG_08268 [Chaetomium globosum CBS 148.51]
MLPNIEAAILEALGLEATSSKLVSHGGSGFSSTYKLMATKDGQQLTFFIKTGTGPDAEVMFRGEHASLNALHAADPSLHLVPRAHAHGALHSSPGKFFRVTDFIDTRSSAPGGTGFSLAAKLARLHTTPAPTPEGFARSEYGIAVPTCCGGTRQDNAWNRVVGGSSTPTGGCAPCWRRGSISSPQPLRFIRWGLPEWRHVHYAKADLEVWDHL